MAMIRISYYTALVVALLLLGCGNQGSGTVDKTPPQVNDQSDLPPAGKIVVGTKPQMPTPSQPQDIPYDVQIVAQGLQVPWDLAFASQNRIYVTERTGRVRLVQNGALQESPYAQVNSASAGEGGLMGIALHPDYPNVKRVYLMYTYSSGGAFYNRVSWFTDTGSGFSGEKILVDKIKGESYHDGGALRFGPDGMLYIGTGDAGNPESAQDLTSPNGKILRITADGGTPADNPFDGSMVYAYGFRNVQGLAWNPANGDLWATNHGPSGEFGERLKDSVFIVQKGGNHGWPRTLGVTDIRAVVPPVLYYPEQGAPPALAMFYDGDMMPELRGNFFFATLRTEYLERVVVTGKNNITQIERWFTNKYGRLRAVVQGPDGSIYLTTSNRDNRGRVRDGDDKIIRISAPSNNP